MVLGVISHLNMVASVLLGEKLAVYVSEGLPEVVVGDPRRFQQIITNLVGNSIKVGL